MEGRLPQELQIVYMTRGQEEVQADKIHLQTVKRF